MMLPAASYKARPLLKCLRSCSLPVEYRKQSFATGNESGTQIKSLNNGLRIAYEDLKTQTCTVGVYLDVGSRYELDNLQGAAHFWQNIAFKGTNKRSQKDIENQAADRGANLFASTTRESNSISVQCLPKDVPWAIELLSEVIKNNVFDSHVVKNEIKLITKRMEEEEQNLKHVVLDYLHATAYQGTPLGKPVIGQLNVVQNMTSDKLKEYVDGNFKAPRMVLAVAGGGINSHQVFDVAEKNLSDVSITYESGAIPVRRPIRFTGSELRDRDDAYPIAHCAFAIEGPGWLSLDSIPLRVAAAINGSWQRGDGGYPHYANKLAQLFQSEGILHSYESFFECYHDTSLWGMHCTVERMSQDQMTKKLFKEWVRIATNAGQFEVERAKRQLITTLVHQHSRGSAFVCDEIGRHLFAYNRRIPLIEMIHRINEVTAAHVREAGDKYIYDCCPAVSAFGPIEALEHYDRFRNHLYSITT